MGPYLSNPKKEKDVQNGESTSVRYGACGMQGWRNTMEDSHIAHMDLPGGVSIFGVFDGHGGREVALYVKDIFEREIKKLDAFKRQEWAEALKQTFIKIDEILLSPQGLKDIKKYQSTEESQPSLFGRPQTDNIALFTGCTACVALVTDKEVIVANAGDSRCVLSKGGRAVELSVDHKPELLEEKKRIERAGGFVEENRVKGVLNLSRSMGDMEYKNDKNLKVEEQMITVVPEIKIEERKSDCEFLVIACDGIWDCLTSQQAVDFVHEYLNS